LSYKGSVEGYGDLLEGLDYREGNKELNSRIGQLGENIPPLSNTYMNLSPTRKNFGTTLNNKSVPVEETGILITLTHIYETKKHRHIETYSRDRYFEKSH